MNPEIIAFARLTKVDEAKRLVYGRAVQEVPDRVGEIFDYETSKPNFQAWSKSQSEASLGKSDGNIRAMHKDVSAGIIVPGGLTFNDVEKCIDVCAKIGNDAEWEGVLDGRYTGFSIGGSYAKKWEDAALKKTRYTAMPSEISLVDRPCVGTATFFDIQKADGSVMQKNFAASMTEEEKAAHEAEEAKAAAEAALAAAGKKPDAKTEESAVVAAAAADKEMAEKSVKVMRTDGTDLEVTLLKTDLPAVGEEVVIDGTTFQLSKVEGEVAYFDEVFAVEGTPAELGAFAKALGERKLTIVDATNAVLAIPAPVVKMTVEEKARELYKAAGGTDEDETKLAQFRIEAKKVLDAEDAAPAPEALSKGAVTATFADEKNKRFPIDSAVQVQAALTYANMEKTASLYAAEDLALVKTRIAEAAVKYGVDPVTYLEASKAAPNKGLAKVLLVSAAGVALIDALAKFADAEELALVIAAEDHDDAGVYAGAVELVKRFADLTGAAALGNNESASESNPEAKALLEVSQRLQTVQKRFDAIVGVTEESVDVKAAELAKAAGVEAVTPELKAQAAAELRKAGARNSKADAARIQAVHDHACDLGAACKAAAMAAAEPTRALAKGDEPMSKQLAETTATLGKALERLAKLEAQPMPVRGVIKMVAVGKQDDVSSVALSAAEQLASTVQPVFKNDGSVDEVATAMKMVLAKGGVKVSMQKS